MVKRKTTKERTKGNTSREEWRDGKRKSNLPKEQEKTKKEAEPPQIPLYRYLVLTALKMPTLESIHLEPHLQIKETNLILIDMSIHK